MRSSEEKLCGQYDCEECKRFQRRATAIHGELPDLFRVYCEEEHGWLLAPEGDPEFQRHSKHPLPSELWRAYRRYSDVQAAEPELNEAVDLVLSCLRGMCPTVEHLSYVYWSNHPGYLAVFDRKILRIAERRVGLLDSPAFGRGMVGVDGGVEAFEVKIDLPFSPTAIDVAFCKRYFELVGTCFSSKI